MPDLGASIAAVATTLGATGVTAASVNAWLLSTVATASLSALVQSLMPRPEMNGGGIQTEVTTTGDDEARSFILGTYCTAGHGIAVPYVGDTDKDDNKYLTYVIDIADTVITDVIEWIVDGKSYKLKPQVQPGHPAWHPDDQFGQRYDGEIGSVGWVSWHDGTQTAADPVLMQFMQSMPVRPTNPKMIMKGVSYAVQTFKYLNKDPKYSGLPEVRYVVRGKPLYDPRKDSSVGGVGAHRWGDESTYEHSDNPVVQIFNILRGITIAPGHVWGVGASADALPLAEFVTAMNICDQDGTEPAGANWYDDRKRYRAGIEIKTDQEPLSVIEELLKACGGVMGEYGGTYSISLTPGLSIFTINDDDLIYSEERTYTITDGLQGTYNGVTAGYPSPQKLWEEENAVPLFNEEWEAEDGGRRLVANVKFAAVPYRKQVRRLMREMAADNRRARRLQIVLPPTCLAALKGINHIRFNSTKHGFDNKLFSITNGTVDSKTLNVYLGLRERSPSDYSFSPVSDGRVPYVPNPDVVSPVITGVSGFAATGIAIKDNTGAARRPAIRLDWSDDLNYNAVSYEVRLLTTQEVVSSGEVSDVQKAVAFITSGILAQTNYQVRARAVYRGRNTAWSAWINVTTPAVFLGNGDFADGVVGLFEDAGMKATREIANRTVPGAYDGELAWSRADNALFLWDAAKSEWIPHIQRALNEVLETTMEAQKLATIKVVAALPATGTLGAQVSLNGKIYRWNGTKWTAEVQAVEITGLLTNAQLQDIAAAKISGQITATQVSDNAIQARSLANGAVSSPDKLGDNVIVARTIQAGAIGAREIAAEQITAKHMVISAFDNLCPDNQIQDLSSWSLFNAAAIDISTDSAFVTNKPASSIGCFRFRGADASSYIRAHSGWFPVTPGDELWLSAEAWVQTNPAGSSGTASWNVQFVDASGASISTPTILSRSHNGTSYTGNQRQETSASVPANAAKARLYCSLTSGSNQTWIFASPRAWMKAGGHLIVDGAITADKIKANEITGDKLTVDAITAREIKASSITANHMTADSITGREIKANSIVAGHLTTDSITSSHVRAGAIGADQIAARAIVASKLAIADFTNQVPDDQLQDDYSWVKGAAFTLRTTAGRNDIKSVGDIVYWTANNTGSTDQTAYTRSFFAVTPGDELYVSAQIIRSGGTTMYARAQLLFYDKNDVVLASGGNVSPIIVNGTSNTATPHEGSVTVPVGALQARFRFYVHASGTDGNVVFAAPTVRVKGTGKLIVDGSVHANAITAGTITGGLLSATGIISKSGQIDNAVITNAKVVDGTFTYLKIGNNQLYIPRFYTRADVTLSDATNNTNPTLLFNQNIPDFNGGGYIIAFNGTVDSNINYDSFGRFQLLIDDAVVQTVSAGMRVSGANGGGFFSVSLMATYNGSGSTNVKVRGWSHAHNDVTGVNGNADCIVRNMSLTISGTRR